MIGIRVDGNEQIGMGHVMRCFAIGRALQRLGHNPLILTSDLEVIKLADSYQFFYEQLNPKCQLDINEISEVADIIRKNRVDKFIVDSYLVTEYYMKEIMKLSKLIYIDDVYRFKYPTHYIVNYNINSMNWGYKQDYDLNQLILGTKYTPLREDYQDIKPITIKSEVREVLITTGSTDPQNICYKIASYLGSKDKAINYNIIVGPFFKEIDQLEALADSYPNIVLHKNVINIGELMKKSDLAISAGGSTLYELCAYGLPIITFSFVENQKEAIKEFAKNSVVLSLGSWSSKSLMKLEMCFKELVENKSKRIVLGRCTQKITDGKGAIRLAQKILEIYTG